MPAIRSAGAYEAVAKFALRNQIGPGKTVLNCFQIRIREVNQFHDLIPK